MDTDKRRSKNSDLSRSGGEWGKSSQRMLAIFTLGIFCGLFAVGQGAQANLQFAAVPEVIPGGVWSLLGLLILVQLLNGVCAAAETAVALLRPMHVKHLKEKTDARGARLQELLDRQQTAAAACQLARYIVLPLVFLIALLIAPSLAPWAHVWFGWAPDNYFTLLAVATILVIFPIGPLTLVIEQVFRTFSVVHPHSVALRLYPFIRTLAGVLAFPARSATGFAKLITSRMNRGHDAVSNQAEQEIRTLVESAEESGEIETEERELLHSVFEFSDTVAREIMTPRVDIDAMSVTSDPADVMKLVHDSGHSRIPLYENTDDQIVGIIHAKDLLMAMLRGRVPSLRALMRPAHFVPENKNLHELLSELRKNRTQMAVVQDEFGGTAGIVTIEDIVEELVGDIMDEYDVEEAEIVPVDAGWSVDGRTHLDDLNDATGAEFESEEFDTVGGFLFGAFGRQPKVRESIDLDGHRFTVVHTDGRRVNRLLVEKLSEDRESLGAETG